MLAPFFLACAQARPENATEMLERAELRDAWLATLLPVAVAGLLLLVLLVSWQRRHGSTSLDSLFSARRLPDIRRGWREVTAAYTQWQAERRENAAASLAAAQEDARVQALATSRSEAKPDAKIMSLDGRAPILEAGQRIRVRTNRSDIDGPLIDITDAGLKFPAWQPEKTEIRWDEVRELSVRVGPERRLWLPYTLAALGAAPLGFIGFVLDMLGQSTSGNPQSTVMLLGILIGGLIGGLLGTLIMYALPGPRWHRLVEAPNNLPPLTLATFAARAAATAGSTSDSLAKHAR